MGKEKEMNLNVFLAWLNIATSNYCKQHEPVRFQECYEHITECVMDGETFKWCVEDREKYIKTLCM